MVLSSSGESAINIGNDRCTTTGVKIESWALPQSAYKIHQLGASLFSSSLDRFQDVWKSWKLQERLETASVQISLTGSSIPGKQQRGQRAPPRFGGRSCSSQGQNPWGSPCPFPGERWDEERMCFCLARAFSSHHLFSSLYFCLSKTSTKI